MCNSHKTIHENNLCTINQLSLIRTLRSALFKLAYEEVITMTGCCIKWVWHKDVTGSRHIINADMKLQNIEKETSILDGWTNQEFKFVTSATFSVSKHSKQHFYRLLQRSGGKPLHFNHGSKNQPIPPAYESVRIGKSAYSILIPADSNTTIIKLYQIQHIFKIL